MNKISLEFNQDSPKYIQISEHIKHLINSNDIKQGQKLPTIRQLSKELQVNTVTIINAYNKLEEEGYVIKKIGSGTYVKIRTNIGNFRREYNKVVKNVTNSSLQEYIDFTGANICTDFFPIETFKSIINEVLDRDGVAALNYQDSLGYYGLRNSINSYFWNENLNIDDILIVSGAQQGIDIVTKSLINVNDNVIVEKPTYSGALAVFKWKKANIIEVELENDGINLDKFEDILKKNNIKCFYTMSYFQNPTGITCSMQKKKRILELANLYDFYIIEDDYLSELIYDSSIEYKSLKSLDKYNRVIYIRSFSKIFLPGIRIGYLISPHKYIDSIRNSKINTDISTSSIMQRVLSLYIKKGYWKKYINYLNCFYSKRYKYMESYICNKLKNYVSFIKPNGGLNFYLKLSDKIDMDCVELFYECKNKNVIITPGVLFYKFSYEGKRYFKLSFSLTDEEQIKEGIDIIYKIIKTKESDSIEKKYDKY